MIIVDKGSNIPIYEQIVLKIERLIELGVLKVGDKIPAVRTLATELTINPNTVQKAYFELESAGITTSRHGIGRFVSEGAKEAIVRRHGERDRRLYDMLCEFQKMGISKSTVTETVNRIWGEADD